MEFLDKLKTAGKMRDEIIATDCLVTAKATVRAYAIAITETASSEVREVLKKQLNEAIDQHEKIANFMIKNDMYRPYDVDDQLSHDKEKVQNIMDIINEK